MTRAKNWPRSSGLAVGGARRVEVERQHVLDLESLVDAKQAVEARGQAAPRRSAAPCSSHLEADQPLAQPQSAAAFGDGAAACAQRLIGSLRVSRHAGSTPNTTLGEQRERQRRTASTTGSTRTSVESRQVDGGAARPAVARIHAANSTPSAPPATAKHQTFGERLAELAAGGSRRGRCERRSSRLRDATRDSNKFARLKQTMSSTAPTAAVSIQRPSERPGHQFVQRDQHRLEAAGGHASCAGISPARHSFQPPPVRRSRRASRERARRSCSCQTSRASSSTLNPSGRNNSIARIRRRGLDAPGQTNARTIRATMPITS